MQIPFFNVCAEKIPTTNQMHPLTSWDVPLRVFNTYVYVLACEGVHLLLYGCGSPPLKTLNTSLSSH